MLAYFEAGVEFRKFRMSPQLRVLSLSFGLCLFLNIGFVGVGWGFYKFGLLR